MTEPADAGGAGSDPSMMQTIRRLGPSAELFEFGQSGHPGAHRHFITEVVKGAIACQKLVQLVLI
jgi:hypothetical protein